MIQQIFVDFPLFGSLQQVVSFYACPFPSFSTSTPRNPCCIFVLKYCRQQSRFFLKYLPESPFSLISSFNFTLFQFYHSFHQSYWNSQFRVVCLSSLCFIFWSELACSNLSNLSSIIPESLSLKGPPVLGVPVSAEELPSVEGSTESKLPSECPER